MGQADKDGCDSLHQVVYNASPRSFLAKELAAGLVWKNVDDRLRSFNTAVRYQRVELYVNIARARR